MTRVAVVQNPDHPAWNAYVRAVREVASRMNVEVTPMPASSASEVEIGLAAFGRTPNGGVILLPSPLVTTNRDMIAALALQQRLPSIYSTREYPQSGGLMSYGIDNTEPFRQAPTYVNRILNGAKPEDLYPPIGGGAQCVCPRRCPSRVKMRRTRNEHMSAGLPPITDIARRGWHGRKVPTAVIRSPRRRGRATEAG
jgi:ABC-type uncharacterized transport system substrate-binding protein